MKVKCINKGNEDYLTIGKVYGVIDEDGHILIINDIEREYWYPKNWFELVKQLNKKIVCIDNANHEDSITIGKTYEVIFDYYNYKIIDDNNKYRYYQKERFKTILEVRKEKINKLLE